MRGNIWGMATALDGVVFAQISQNGFCRFVFPAFPCGATFGSWLRHLGSDFRRFISPHSHAGLLLGHAYGIGWYCFRADFAEGLLSICVPRIPMQGYFGVMAMALGGLAFAAFPCGCVRVFAMQNEWGQSLDKLSFSILFFSEARAAQNEQVSLIVGYPQILHGLSLGWFSWILKILFFSRRKPL